eukprot:1161809-Pelagomonas_calceolata.AAC.9
MAHAFSPAQFRKACIYQTTVVGYARACLSSLGWKRYWIKCKVLCATCKLLLFQKVALFAVHFNNRPGGGMILDEKALQRAALQRLWRGAGLRKD